MRYKAIVFDFFGVICSEVAPFWLTRHFTDSEAKRIKAHVVHAADLGDISQEEMFGQLGAMTNTHPSQVEREWFEHVQIDTAAVDLVRKSKQWAQLGLLTNSPSGFIRSILREYQLDTMFDAIVVSSEVRRAKPDASIYELMLASLSVPAGVALMIDDNPVNVDGAVRVGMEGILFGSVVQLELALQELFAR